METPDYNHMFRNQEYSRHVYEPSEDTFVLLDALEQDLLKKNNEIHQTAFHLCLELGTGNGVPGTFLLKLLSKSVGSINPAFLVMTDINDVALDCASETVTSNKCRKSADLLRSDLLTAFRPKTKFDLIIFNPPYVCSDSEEFSESQKLSGNRDKVFAALSGGISGTELIDVFLEQLENFLADRGSCYLVLIDRNQPEVVKCRMQNKDWVQSAELIFTRRAGIETLFVLKITAK